MRTLYSTVVSSVLLLAAAPATSHHSFTAEFDINRPIEFTGTIKAVQWSNPHAWLFVDTEDGNGDVQSWEVELLGINTLLRRGWTRDTVTAGDVVNIRGFGARDGSNKANASAVSLAASGELLWEASDE